MINIAIKILHVKKQVKSLTVGQFNMGHFGIVCWREKVLIVLDDVTQPLLVNGLIIIALTLASQLSRTRQNEDSYEKLRE